MQLVFLGPPGAGKGTLAEKAAAAFGPVHLSTGDILRAEIAKGSPLGRKIRRYVDRGQLVPQAIMGEVVAARLAGECSFILDGFPRTLEQAAFLAALPGLALDAVIYVSVPEDEALRRLGRRRVCASCHAVTAVEDDGDAADDECDRCGGQVVVRADDRPETTRERYRIYVHDTAPLVEYYRKNGLLREVDGVGTKQTVWGRVNRVLAALAAPRDDNY